MGATVHDIHHRDRQDLGVGAADVAEQRQLKGHGSRLGGGQGNAQDGVGAQLALGGGAVELKHARVDVDLVGGVAADQLRGDQLVHVLHGLEDPLAKVALAVDAGGLLRLE